MLRNKSLDLLSNTSTQSPFYKKFLLKEAYLIKIKNKDYYFNIFFYSLINIIDKSYRYKILLKTLFKILLDYLV